MQKEWYFLRHGQTDFNLKGIVQGSGVDSSLNDTGKNQAEAFYKSYKKINFDKIIVSNLKRTYQTVQLFVDDGLPFEKDSRINEMNWGIHEGKPSKEGMIQQYKAMIAQWNVDNFDARLEEGESARELSNRIHSFLESLKQREEQRLLICTHGRSMRCLVALLKGQHLREMENVKHANTGLYKVVYHEERLSFDLENDTTHLK